jgi:hypothetical protein
MDYSEAGDRVGIGMSQSARRWTLSRVSRAHRVARCAGRCAVGIGHLWARSSPRWCGFEDFCRFASKHAFRFCFVPLTSDAA